MVHFSRPITAATAIFTLISSIAASPIELHLPKVLEARQDGSLPVVGVTSGGVQPRLELRELEKQHEQFTLFIIALTRFQAVDQNDRESYYQIAGIHGQPYAPWDGVETKPNANPNIGYCTHSVNLFAIWHRPYLSLFEQTIHKHAEAIVNEIPDGDTKTKYQDALDKLRLPYWDWALNVSPVVPGSIGLQTLKITYPNGTEADIPNPLHEYRFHPLDTNQITGIFTAWDETKRQPATATSESDSRSDEVERVLAENLSGARSRLYALLSTYQPMNSFSNQEGEGFDSIENLHGNIHTGVGGDNGHMTDLAVSGFDPIFFLHHANVDRQLALFQKLYPDTYVEAAGNKYATFTIETDSVQDANSPLTPFHSDTAGNFINANSARSIEDWGYTYPELADNPSNDTIRSRINDLYGSSTTSLSRRPSAESDSASTMSSPEAPRAYFARVKIPMVGNQYTVRVNVDGSFVASAITLARNVKEDKGVIQTSSLDLTEVLEKKFSEGALKDLDKESALSYLRGSLSWSVTESGKEVQDVKGLTVKVVSIEVVPPTSASEFPEWKGGFEEDDGGSTAS